MGDVKLMAMVGAFLGWQATLLVVLLGSMLGLALGIIIIAHSPKGARAKTKLPFGTFLAIAALVALLWGDWIIAWYAGFFVGIPPP